MARQAAATGDVERACAYYRTSLHTWRDVNQKTEKAWQEQERLTNSEYAHYLLNGKCIPLHGRQLDTQ